LQYRVDVHPRARRAFASLPVEEKRRIAAALDRLERDPRARGTKKLVGSLLWRVRVGEYRIIYSIADRERIVLVVEIVRRTTTTYD
jgi:mRNA interferase RelE/StbE